MTPTLELTDVLKNAPTASSLSGLSMLCVNSLGNAVKVPYILTITVENLDMAFTPGVYIVADPLGTRPSNAQEWGFGILEVFNRWNMIIQRLTSTYGNMAIRVRTSDGVMGSWKIALMQVL